MLQFVLRAVAIAMNGMTTTFAKPRASQMSASRRAYNIASA
jgi:hypothetical protein